MNRKQKIGLWIGIAIFVLMGVFPPWVYTYSMSSSPFLVAKEDAGYRLIFTPPPPRTRVKITEGMTGQEYKSKLLEQKVNPIEGVLFDTSRLYVQWAMVAVVTGGLLITFKDTKKD